MLTGTIHKKKLRGPARIKKILEKKNDILNKWRDGKITFCFKFPDN